MKKAQLISILMYIMSALDLRISFMFVRRMNELLLQLICIFLSFGQKAGKRPGQVDSLLQPQPGKTCKLI